MIRFIGQQFPMFVFLLQVLFWSFYCRQSGLLRSVKFLEGGVVRHRILLPAAPRTPGNTVPGSVPTVSFHTISVLFHEPHIPWFPCWSRAVCCHAHPRSSQVNLWGYCQGESLTNLVETEPLFRHLEVEKFLRETIVYLDTIPETPCDG